MKKLNYAKIITLVLSLALLLGAVVAVSASAEEASNKGTFGGISLAYGDNVAISVIVRATQEEIENGDVVVAYTIEGNETEYKANYYRTDDKGNVWVRTSGIEAYNLAKVVTFNSYVGETQVESGKTYSVAQFLYTMLHKNDELDEKYKNLYQSLLTYGAAAQTALNKDADKLVTDSTIVFTKNTEIKINGNGTAFAPAGKFEDFTPVYTGTVPAFKVLEGWNIIDNGEDKVVGLSFDCSGVVEVVSPIIADQDPAPFTLANGGFENGLEGWTLVGNIGGISSERTYWNEGIEFGMDGDNMFSAYVDGATEGAVGTLTSSSFIVGGTGYITYKIGGMKDGNYVWLDVVDAETKEILVRYYNGQWTDADLSGCKLVAYKADLSEFIGREVFFRLSDNADSGYGLFFADSFDTYHTSVPGGEYNVATPVGYAVSGTIYDVFNGGFEYGDNRGWWNVGEPGAVTGADAFFSGVAYGKDGNFLYSGVEDHMAGNGREGNRGVLTSSAFEIGGTGYITFMLGGGGNELCFVQVIDAVTGEILVRYHQQAMEDAVLKTYVADLSAYIGRTVRFQVVDQAHNNWGCVSFDNLVTYYTAKPEGIEAVDIYKDLKYTIDNGSFENGLDGWHQNIWEAGAHNTLGWVESSEHNADWYTKNDDRKDGNNLFTFCRPDGTNCENTKGELVSSTFSLKQGAFVSFKFGGAGTREVRVELCRADGSVIATFYNEAPGKVNTEMYSYYYQYNGPEINCFFRVVDNSTGNYGCFVVDDFRVNLDSAPEGYIEAIC